MLKCKILELEEAQNLLSEVNADLAANDVEDHEQIVVLKVQNKTRQNKIERLNKRAYELEKECSELIALKNQMAGKLQEVQMQKDSETLDLKNQLSCLSGELVESKAKNNNLEEELADLKNQVERLDKRAYELENESSEMIALKNQMAGKLQEVQMEKDSETLVLKNQLLRLSGELVEAKAKNNNLEEELTQSLELKNQLARLSGELAEAKAKNDCLQGELGHVKEELDSTADRKFKRWLGVEK